MIKTSIGTIIKTSKYDIKEVKLQGKTAKISFSKKEEGKYYSIIPLFEDSILKIRKMNDGDYTLMVNGVDEIMTRDVKKGGMISLDLIYLGLDVLVFPAPIE